jgi:hypothetical protein
MHRFAWVTAGLLASGAEVKVAVSDPTGRAIPSATVAAECAGGQKRTMRTDAALQLARRQETIAVKESLGKRFKNWVTSCTRR